jgi:hypothetical protein
MNKQTRNKTNKQTKIPGSGAIEFQSILISGVTPPVSIPGVGM